jgi:hypothetical protein
MIPEAERSLTTARSLSTARTNPTVHKQPDPLDRIALWTRELVDLGRLTRKVAAAYAAVIAGIATPEDVETVRKDGRLTPPLTESTFDAVPPQHDAAYSHSAC